MDEFEIGQSVYDVLEDSYVAGTVSVDISEAEEMAYNDNFDDDLLQNFHNNHKGDDLGYNEDGEGVESTTSTDKKDYDTEEFDVFEDILDVSEVVADNCAKDEVIEDDVVKAAELTVEKQVEQIATTIQMYYKSYDYLSAENKERLFNFRVDDNSYNLEFYAQVLKKLGVQMYVSDRFEDYQSIYAEMMKKAEKQDSEHRSGYEDKKWETGRGR